MAHDDNDARDTESVEGRYRWTGWCKRHGTGIKPRAELLVIFFLETGDGKSEDDKPI
jgi:hypothetical protein